MNVPLDHLQRYLAILGLYDPDRIDGKWGNRTNTGVHRFCDWKRIYGSDEAIFQAVKKSAIEVLPQTDWTQEKTLDEQRACFVRECINCCYKMGLGEPPQIAYTIATAEHETGDGKGFRPNREADHVPDPHRAEEYRRNLRYHPYYGRGLIHWTWESNYRISEKMLQLPLLEKPDIALMPQVALFLLVWTMKTGKATGVALDKFIDNGRVDFVKARSVVNGNDQQDKIARMAEGWQQTLEKEYL